MSAGPLQPIDDTMQKRVGKLDTPSYLTDKEINDPRAIDTSRFYAPLKGEESVDVTATFGGTRKIWKERFDNTYTPMVNAIIATVTKRKKTGPKQFISVGGSAGSGKSTDRRLGTHGIPKADAAVHIDADEIKTLFPEARQLHAAGNPHWASAVHEESKTIADMSIVQALEEGLDVVYDSTGQYNAGFGTLTAARAKGYDIVAHYNVAPESALTSNVEARQKTDPRRLPSSFITAVMNTNYRIMPKVAEFADEFYLWDSEDITTRKLLAEKKKGGTLKILDPLAYVHADFDDTNQTVKMAGRPTIKVDPKPVSKGSRDGQILTSFEAGKSIEKIAEDMKLPRRTVFDAVVKRRIDPSIKDYVPPVVRPTEPTVRKPEKFVEDDDLKNTFDALPDPDKQLVRDVISKQPGAMDKFNDKDLPLDLLIWASQNNITGKMSFSKEKNAEIDEYIKNNQDESNGNIGKKLNISTSFVKVRREALGLGRSEAKPSVSKRIPEIDEHLTNNPDHSNNHISRKLGVGSALVKKRRKILGIQEPATDKGLIRRLSAEKISMIDGEITRDPNQFSNAIAKKLGVPESVVASRREVLNLPSPRKAGPRIPEKTKRAIDKDLINNPSESDSEIARRHNTSPNTVGKRRRSLDLIKNPPAKQRDELVGDNTGYTVEREISKEKQDAVVSEYLSGGTSTEIARKLKISVPSVRRILRDGGIPMRQNAGGRRTDKSKEDTPTIISGNMSAMPTDGFKPYSSAEDRKKTPTFRGKPWKDVEESLNGMPWPFKGQAEQFEKIGPPGLSYFKGTGNGLKPNQWVDCLLWRDDSGILKGIVYHYPQDLPLEKKGNMNVFISPDSKRQGIANRLVAEAIKRYNVDLRQQKYSEEGAAFINNFVRNMPENKGK
jgi:DNA-binding NarL/FixJ family response regulator